MWDIWNDEGSRLSVACVADVRRGGRGVKRASAGKNERARHTRGEAGVSLPLPLACFTRSLAPLFFFRARLCYSLSLPSRRIITIFDIKKRLFHYFLRKMVHHPTKGPVGMDPPPPKKKECFTPGLKLECLQWPDHFTLFNYCMRVFHNVIFLRGVSSRLCLQSSLCLAGVKRVIAPAFYTLIKISWIRFCNFTLKSIQKPLSMFKWTGHLANLF